MDFQSKGKTAECSQYQQMLHRNLVYLATIADSNQNMQSLLPAPPSQNMAMGPGGMNQSGPPQPPHGHSMPPEGMVGGGPPASHMQNQMNGQMPGPMMHQQPPSQQYSIPQGGGQHYQGQQNTMAMMAQVSQGNHVMGQRPMPPYRPPQQGPSQGTPGQYPSYSQGQGQQYGGYRPPQPGQPQQQRPYGYDQGQYGNYQQ
ncbi:UNVERIFIED_CONTAM: hypothetical protein FKN15_072643 [Acipenser sinensis]